MNALLFQLWYQLIVRMLSGEQHQQFIFSLSEQRRIFRCFFSLPDTLAKIETLGCNLLRETGRKAQFTYVVLDGDRPL